MIALFTISLFSSIIFSVKIFTGDVVYEWEGSAPLAIDIIACGLLSPVQKSHPGASQLTDKLCCRSILSLPNK